MSIPRRQGLAAFLSALLPGLGQLYNRQWAKGAGFFLAIVVLDWALGVSEDSLIFLRSAAAGLPTVDAGRLLVRMLPLLAVAVWSIADAAHTAKQTSL
jgi:arabinogalactan oligomer / maltooligosaccharide transport system permease protein